MIKLGKIKDVRGPAMSVCSSGKPYSTFCCRGVFEVKTAKDLVAATEKVVAWLKDAFKKAHGEPDVVELRIDPEISYIFQAPEIAVVQGKVRAAPTVMNIVEPQEGMRRAADELSADEAEEEMVHGAG